MLQNLCVTMCLAIACSAAFGQAPRAGSPVVLDGTELFRMKARVGAFSEADRARAISERILELANDTSIPDRAIAVAESDLSTDVVVGDRIIVSISDRDGASEGQNRSAVARRYAEEIRAAVVKYRRDHSKERLVRGLAISAAATVALLVGCWLAVVGIRRLGDVLRNRLRETKMAHVAEGMLGVERLARLRRLARRAALALAFAALVHLYLIVVALQFPALNRLKMALLDDVSRPVVALGAQVVAQLPNVAYVCVIFAFAFAVNKALHVFFRSIELERIHISGFYPDWAEPTYRLSALVVIVAAAIVAFPYVPGSDSTAFRGVSILAGVIFSIGSTSLVGNAFAGVVLIYMRSFRIGDRVKIADTIGDVEEKTLLVTRIKTVKNEHITIANSMILGSHVINYSKAALEDGLVLYTDVTIGYDAPWRTVHELLLRAAANTTGVSETPAPFVLQTSLCDSYVQYQINVYTTTPRRMTAIYSELRANIQDSFNAAGVEIMSPAYHAVRDGNHVTIPRHYLPSAYESPGFRVVGANGRDGRQSGAAAG